MTAWPASLLVALALLGACADAAAAGVRASASEFAEWPARDLHTFLDRGRIVLQPATGLEWQKPAATGPAMDWSDARDACAALELDGGGWRLPTRIEAVTLVDYTRYDPATTFPGLPSDGFWVSTRDQNFASGIYWAVDFRSGATPDFREGGTRYRPLCVR